MKKLYAVQFTRKRKNLTDYRKRLRLLMSGQPRLIIRKTSTQIIVQIAKFEKEGDKVLISVNSKQLKKQGWKFGVKNIPAAYLTGLLAGKLALKSTKVAVLDSGVSKPISKGRIYAALKGILDAGLNVKSSLEIFPDEERLSGKHISAYISSSKSPNQFSLYSKNNLTPEKLTENFQKVKTKIGGAKNA
jgi:large subunit ribosomal protein L18